MRDFARAHIHSYLSSGDGVSRSPLPPSWQNDAAEPLVWREDAAPVALPPAPAHDAPAVPEAQQEIPAPQPAAPAPGVVTHKMLERLLAAHEERMAKEGTATAPLSSPDSAPAPVQRQPDLSSDAGDASPRVVTRRRRGAVIDVPSQPSSSPADEETPPDFFFLNDAAPETPAVQRAPADLPAPQTQTEAPKPASPATSFWRRLFSRGDDTANTVPDSAADSSPSVESSTPVESAAAQPLTSAETPSFSESNAPAIQRATETAAAQPSSQPSTQQQPMPQPAAEAATKLTPIEPQESASVRENALPSLESSSTYIQENASPETMPGVQRIAPSETVQREAALEHGERVQSPPHETPTLGEVSNPTAQQPQQNVSGSQPAPMVQRDAEQQAFSDQPSAASSTTSGDPSGIDPPQVGTHMPFTPAAEPSLQRKTDAPQSFASAIESSSAETNVDQASGVTPPAQRQTMTPPKPEQPSSTIVEQTPNVQRQANPTAANTGLPIAPASAETPVAEGDMPSASQAFASAPAPDQPTVRRKPEQSARPESAPLTQSETPSPAISRQTGVSPNPVAQRQSSPDDQPIVPVREQPVTAIQRDADPQASGSSDLPESNPPAIAPEPSLSDLQGVGTPTPPHPASAMPVLQPDFNEDTAPSAPAKPLSAIKWHIAQPNLTRESTAKPIQRTSGAIRRKAISGARPPARRVQHSTSFASATEQQSTELDSSAPEAPQAAAFTPVTPQIQRSADVHEQDNQHSHQSLTGEPAFEAGDEPTSRSLAAPPSSLQRDVSLPDISHIETGHKPHALTTDVPTILTPIAPQPAPHASAPVVQSQTSTGINDADEATPQPETKRLPPTPPSPWSAFIQPPASALPPAPVQRSAVIETPQQGATAQRTIKDAPALPSSETAPRPSADDVPSLPEHSVDLFTALRDAGMIPSSPPDSPATAQGLQQTVPDVIHRSSSPALPEESQIAPVERSIEASTAPEDTSTDAELLSLLDLPPTTPVIRQAQSSPVVSRSISPDREQPRSEPAEPTARPPLIDEQSGDRSGIMRVETTAPTDTAAPAQSEEGGATQGEVNVDKLARDVLDVLRQRLRIEQERRGGRP